VLPVYLHAKMFCSGCIKRNIAGIQQTLVMQHESEEGMRLVGVRLTRWEQLRVVGGTGRR